MPDEIVEGFARLLVKHVRDAAIQNTDVNLKKGAQSLIAKRWREAAGPKGKPPPEMVISDAVDSAVFHLLNAIDNGLLRLCFKTADGTVVDLQDAGEGEMGGWYMGSGGWRAMFSKERFYDDLANLEL